MAEHPGHPTLESHNASHGETVDEIVPKFLRIGVQVGSRHPSKKGQGPEIKDQGQRSTFLETKQCE
ncbi:hypothetical protein EYF80_066136 [Liparis tanakae]|uniref:Uncharacterized protein n=1 Tax=Liparis tanakae TaxID=230148 RepID=A0A4Z2E5W6_9TELE|nr:hypothetical protein EYF80_066136 [Liparis tanakae]